MQLNDPQKQHFFNTRNKPLVILASGVVTIFAVISCLLLIIPQIDQPLNKEQTTYQNISSNQHKSHQSTFLPSNDIHVSALQTFSLFSVQKFTQKSLELTLTVLKSLSSSENSPLKRIATLILKYSFDLLDSDGTKTVSQVEWNNFIGTVFPQDVEKYAAVYKQINSGRPFKLEHFTSFFVSLQNAGFKNLASSADINKTALNFARFLVNDLKNYKLTYQFMFRVLDINDNLVVTKAEYENTFMSLGSAEKKAKRYAEKAFAFATENKFCEDRQTVKYPNYVKYALSVRNSVQNAVQKYENKLLLEDSEGTWDNTEIIEAHFSVLIQAIQQKDLLSLESQQHSEPINVRLSATISECFFKIMDTDQDQVVSQQEFNQFISQIYKNAYDREHFYQKYDLLNLSQDGSLNEFKSPLMSKKSDLPNHQQPDSYSPKENIRAIERRLSNVILKNDDNYKITLDSVFDFFDRNQDNIVELSEISTLWKDLSYDDSQLERIQKSTEEIFKYFVKNSGGSNGAQINKQQWEIFSFNQQMRQEIEHSQKDQSLMMAFFLFLIESQ